MWDIVTNTNPNVYTISFWPYFTCNDKSLDHIYLDHAQILFQILLKYILNVAHKNEIYRNKLT